MTVGMLEGVLSYEEMSERIKEINPKAKLSTQGIAERVNSQGAVEYLKEVLKQAVEESIKAELERIDSEVLRAFKRVYLEDSTQVEVNEKLAGKFRGSGGSASKASVKIDAMYEVKHAGVEEMIVEQAVTLDQELGERRMEEYKRNIEFK
jgi:hypothetical protein